MQTMNIFSLNGRKAIVTGAGGGLGKAMAAGLHEAGAEVAIVDVSPNVFAAAAELSFDGQPVHAIKGDLSTSEGVGQVFQDACAKLGGTVDILINNAGIQRRGDCESFLMEDWNDVLQVNLTAVFQMCQLAGRIMLQKGKGRIINIASMNSFFGGGNVPAYAVSKGGVAILTKSLSNAWAGRGINVNAIAPGYMDTNMNQMIRNPEINQSLMDRVPKGRWGVPDDMKWTAVFLASDASDYISGAVIPVDGGYLAR